jgi:hypothetical protein
VKIDKVILSTNDNPLYYKFWPYVAKAWERIGIKPILFFIGDTIPEDIENNVYSGGEIIQISPLEDISTAFQSQVIRLVSPSMFPNDIIIISDIDDMPLSEKYFQNNIKDIEDDKFVSYRPFAADEGRGGMPGPNELAMCWNVAKGKVWGDIFKTSVDINDSMELIKSWYPDDYQTYKNGWTTDQVILRKYVDEWELKTNKVVRLNDAETGFFRLDREVNNTPFHTWKFIKEWADKDLYSDYHLHRPLDEYIKGMKPIFKCYGIL